MPIFLGKLQCRTVEEFCEFGAASSLERTVWPASIFSTTVLSPGSEMQKKILSYRPEQSFNFHRVTWVPCRNTQSIHHNRKNTSFSPAANKEGSVSRVRQVPPPILTDCAERGYRYEPPSMFLSHRQSQAAYNRCSKASGSVLWESFE